MVTNGNRTSGKMKLFSVLAGACAAIALGLFYADFVGTGGLD